MTINLKLDLVALVKSLALMPLDFVFVYNFERCSVDQIDVDYFWQKGVLFHLLHSDAFAGHIPLCKLLCYENPSKVAGVQ